jgi:magnesium chelatase family protein
VLFLDELPEFSRHSLEALRQPLESGEVLVSRVGGSVCMPADFSLVATMNPCPCGYLDEGDGRCQCTPHDVARYRGRLSGPLLDRIDLQVRVGRVPWEELCRSDKAESTADVLARVMRARAAQVERGPRGAGRPNAGLSAARVRELCTPTDRGGRQLLRQAVDALQLSARAYDRVLKVARTIADLDQTPSVRAPHLAEALQYRLRTGGRSLSDIDPAFATPITHGATP